MGMRVVTSGKKIVELVDFPFGADHHRFLLTAQTKYPNLPLRIMMGGDKTFIPIHALDLDNFEAIKMLNP